jgi:hypothetical protein
MTIQSVIKDNLLKTISFPELNEELLINVIESIHKIVE